MGNWEIVGNRGNRGEMKTRGRCFLRCIIIDKGKKKKGLGVNTSSIIRAIKKLEKNI